MKLWKSSGSSYLKMVLVSTLVLGLLVGSFAITASGAKKITIGSLMSLTGGLAKYGPPISNGAKLAVRDINKAGGVLGKELEIIVRDTQSERGPARDAASKLVNLDQVSVIIGALSSGSTIAVNTVTSSKDVVLISPSSTSAAIKDLQDDDYTYRTCLGDSYQGVVQGRLAKNLGYKRVAVIFVNNAYGKGLMEIFQKNFEELGGEVVARVPYKVGLPSYGGEASKAVNANPDVISIIGYPTGGNKLLQKTIELGYEGEYIFSDGMKGEGVAPGPTCALDAKPAEQYISGSFGTAPSFGAADEFEEDFKAAYGPSAVPFRAQAYDATVVAALAMQMAGETTGPAIKANLRKVANAPGEKVGYGELEKALKLAKEGKDINWQGVSSAVEFDENGDMASGTIVLWAVQKCQSKNLWYIDIK